MQRIGLIIPAYNEEKLIGDTLRYVAESGHRFSEIIVVDNASTDRTAEIARAFPGVRVVTESHKGVQWARQRGFSESSADILAFMDADNLMPKGWFKKIESAFEGNKNLVLLSGPYHFYDIPWYNKIWLWLYWIFVSVPLYWIIGYMGILGNLAIRRDVLQKMGGFDTSIDFYGDDTDTSYRASKYGKVRFSLSFVMLASGRRLLKQGTWTMAGVYGLNYLSQAFRKQPVHRTHEDIR